jgi:hypothetical protein
VLVTFFQASEETPEEAVLTEANGLIESIRRSNATVAQEPPKMGYARMRWIGAFRFRISSSSIIEYYFKVRFGVFLILFSSPCSLFSWIEFRSLT